MVGAPYSRPVALLSGAIFLRILGTINRAVQTRDFGLGNFVVLCLNVARLTWINAWRQPSMSDCASFALMLWALVSGGRMIATDWGRIRTREAEEARELDHDP